jgi:DNA polymerase I-like protein with 3'-5' exonuclease and polymerase domains
MTFPRFDSLQILALDFETSGLRYWSPDFRVFGVAVATCDDTWYWDVRQHPGVVQWLRDTLPGRPVIAQAAQFEYQCCRVLGIDPRTIDFWCTMTAECLIDEHHMTYDLYSICQHHGIESDKKTELENIRSAMGWKNVDEVMARLDEVPPELTGKYGSSDARDAFRIWQAQAPLIEKQDLGRVMRLERDLLPVLADMSWGGVRVDLEAAHAAIPKLDADQAILEAEIHEIVGCKDVQTFINSPKQVKEFFKPEQLNKFQWRLIDGTIVGPTKSGKGPSLDQNALRAMVHPAATSILALRKTVKLRDTFLRGHVIANADENGYVHTSFHQTRNDEAAGTVTGRLSSTDPALQQIGNRDKKNAEVIRSCFLPDDGDMWMAADYNQVDFRMAAHLIADPTILASYAADPKTDYHAIVSKMTGIPRNPAYAGAPNTKTLNLSLAFGAGPGKTAHSMGMPYEITEIRGRMAYIPGPEASAVFEKYHRMVPGVKRFSKHAEVIARDTGYVRTLMGRRLRFPRKQGAHKAAGLLFQANAADVNKSGLVAVDRLIRSEKLPARLMLSVHDEIDVSMQNDEAMAQRIADAFVSPGAALGYRVPITADVSITPTWWKG